MSVTIANMLSSMCPFRKSSAVIYRSISGRAYYRPEIAGVRFFDFDFAFLAEELPRALRVAIAAPDRVSLALKQMSE